LLCPSYHEPASLQSTMTNINWNEMGCYRNSETANNVPCDFEFGMILILFQEKYDLFIVHFKIVTAIQLWLPYETQSTVYARSSMICSIHNESWSDKLYIFRIFILCFISIIYNKKYNKYDFLEKLSIAHPIRIVYLQIIYSWQQKWRQFITLHTGLLFVIR
jgi:hypothetical protein